MKSTHKNITVGLLVLICAGCEAQIPNKEAQLAMAVEAAPEDKREGATVYGYDENGKLTLIKEGTNELICLSDDPNSKGLNIACYHQDLEPFMARGRQLRAEGKSRSEIFDIREEEAKSGTLDMPENPSTLHVLSGPEGIYNADSMRVENANYRYVVYIPFATPESTGLPIRPMVPGGPWIMDPGTHKAHIMITPPPKK